MAPMTENELRERCLQWRHVRTPCARCEGSGVLGYANGATWRGGAGGASITYDVCNLCWGSGDSTRPFENRKAREKSIRDEVQRRAADLLAKSMGSGLSTLRPGLLMLAGELERLGRGRKPRPLGYYASCTRLAALLRDMAAPEPPVLPAPEYAK